MKVNKYFWVMLMTLISFLTGMILFIAGGFMMSGKEHTIVAQVLLYVGIALVILCVISFVGGLLCDSKYHVRKTKVGENPMRTVITIPYAGDKSEKARQIDQYFRANKWVVAQHRTGEMVYKRGDTILTSLKCIKFTFNDEGFHFELFTLNLMQMEIAIDTYIGALLSPRFMKTMRAIEEIISK